MPRTPAALCMWLEHRPQCSTWSNRQMGVSHSIAMMERNYPAECCPPSHTTSNSLDAQYSPNHSIFLVMTALSIGQDSLMHWNDHMWFEQWLRYCTTNFMSRRCTFIWFQTSVLWLCIIFLHIWEHFNQCRSARWMKSKYFEKKHWWSSRMNAFTGIRLQGFLYLMNKLHGLEVSQKTDVHRVTHYPTQHFKSSESYCDTQRFS